jgi:cell division protein FtsB
MTDVSTFQIIAVLAFGVGCWFSGYDVGKIVSRQQTEARHRTQMKALAAARKRQRQH